MEYLAQPPSPPLRDVVESLWLLSDAPGHGRERIVPTGTVELVLNLHEDEIRIFEPGTGRERRFHGAIASGCYGKAFEIDARAHALVIGVHLRPGGAARLLGVPPGELANDHVGLEELWGSGAIELRERLLTSPSIERRFELLERALITRLADHPRPRPAVSFGLAELERPGVEVGSVVRGLGLSRRRFIELFTEDVGMTPKRYAMVRRFQRALGRALRSSAPVWARIALHCGYFDQSHLCRDWKELTGLSPGEHLALHAVPVKDHHVALPEAGVKFVQDSAASRL